MPKNRKINHLTLFDLVKEREEIDFLRLEESYVKDIASKKKVFLNT